MDAACSGCHSTPREVELARLFIRLVTEKAHTSNLPPVSAVTCISFFRANWTELNLMMDRFLEVPNQHILSNDGVFDAILDDVDMNYNISVSQVPRPGSLPVGKP
jgi:hypothetical protein